MSHLALVVPGIDHIGGAERQVLLLAQGMRRRGWRVTVVALSGAGGDAQSELAAGDVDFVTLQMRKGLADPRGWLRFRRWLHRENPDIVHTHLPHATWLARWSRLAAPMRVLVDTLHSSSTGTMGRRLGYRWSDWLSDQVTAVGESVAEAHRQMRMAAARKLTILPNGVDANAFEPDAAVRQLVRKQSGIGNEFLWLAAGRLDAVKDYPTLLRAFAALPGDPRLAIAGTGACESELRHLTRQLSLGARVEYLGFEANVVRWMQAADGFVLSSRWEGLPMSLLEAGACGLPAAVTDVPGTREIVVDGQTGMLAVSADAPSLQRAMVRVMRLPPAERKAMGARARKLVLDRFCLQSVLDRWEALYAALLARHPVPRRCPTSH